MKETLRSNRFGKSVNLNIESTSRYPKSHLYTDGPVYQYIPEPYLWETTIDLHYPGYNLVFHKDISQKEYNKLRGLLEMNYDIDYNPNDIKFIDSESISIISQYSVIGLKIFDFEFSLIKFVRNKNEKNLL